MEHPSTYRNKNILILGLAKSGVAAARLFHHYGAHVIVNDAKPRAQCHEAEQLELLGITVICGSHPRELVHHDVSLIVKNPGIPYSVDPIMHAIQLGIEIVSEIEVAYQMTQAPIIGITGSNGKTTTTTLIGLILTEAGRNPLVAGNIGRALTDAVLEVSANQWLVAELSSFQLKGTSQFRPRIAVLLNLYDTHLDYHGSLEDYMASKKRIFLNQTSDDIAVLNADDLFCQSLRAELRAKVMPFSLTQSLTYGVFLEAESGYIVFRDENSKRVPFMLAKELGIRGQFNIENAMAAICVALALKVEISEINQVLREFHGVEHRLEFVRELHGVKFYNNSKATNPAATIKSIEAFEEPIVLIAGGLDRGSDYMELLPIFQKRIKAIVTLGQTNEKLKKIAELAFVPSIVTVDADTEAELVIEKAVQLAKQHSSQGDVVLLSPACASWDMFSSYEQRGSMFKRFVNKL
jgi:UDP-N-acetylmuramoylalanine--D-glutamate ligase